MVPARTYFRACGHYHRPGGLNGRVRNGNACGPPGLTAGERPGRWSEPRLPGLRLSRDGYQDGRQQFRGVGGPCPGEALRSRSTPLAGEGESGIKVVKRSPVSTGRLRLLPVLHRRPIDLVVFQGAHDP